MKLLLTTLTWLAFAATAHAAGSHDNDHGHGHANFEVGEPADAVPDRVIEVSMHDTMRFDFSPKIRGLHDGEVIRFEVSNAGAIKHEFSIGNAEEQARHAEMMRKSPNMKHQDPNAVMLEPGESAALTWRFEGDDTVVFACNVPGHYEAGMHHKVGIEDGNQDS